MKPRFNQPSGYRPTGAERPSYHYGRRHDYVFYPVSWTDPDSGTYYEKGYYDENGRRYDNVSFEKNGRFENVVCKCQYCGQETVLNLTADETANKAIQCPACGAPMSIASELDEYDRTDDYARGRSYDDGGTRRRNPLKMILLVIVAVFGISLVNTFLSGGGSSDSGNELVASEESIQLTKTSDHSFAEGGSSIDKELAWDDEFGSYYDADTECWVWFNTDVDPAVWQYWYEGISSDYGDYGWMEHDSEGWWIEESAGNWIALPDKYDTSRLWYIEN